MCRPFPGLVLFFIKQVGFGLLKTTVKASRASQVDQDLGNTVCSGPSYEWFFALSLTQVGKVALLAGCCIKWFKNKTFLLDCGCDRFFFLQAPVEDRQVQSTH